MRYSFEAINDLGRMPLAGKLMNLVEFSPHYGEAVAELYGQLLTLFGEPVYTTQSLEDAYCYIILTRGEDRSEHILNVYEGSSGPAIGGENSAHDAALELKKYIGSAQPTDYEYEGYYFDGPTKIRRGVKDGKAFYSEAEISFEESEQAYKELYPDR